VDRSSNIACVIGITISSGDRDSSLIFPDKATSLEPVSAATAMGAATSASPTDLNFGIGLSPSSMELLALYDGPKRGDPRHDALQ
jgi:hypothetical protein